MGRAAGATGICSSGRRGRSEKRRGGRRPRDYNSRGAAGRSGQGAGGGRGVRTGTSAVPGGCSGEPSGEEEETGGGTGTGGDSRDGRRALGGAPLFAESRGGQWRLMDPLSSPGKSPRSWRQGGRKGFGFRIKKIAPFSSSLPSAFGASWFLLCSERNPLLLIPPLKLWVLYFLIN